MSDVVATKTWLERFRAGEGVVLSYHGKKLPVAEMSALRAGHISVYAVGTGLPVVMRADGTYTGQAPIWLEAPDPATEIARLRAELAKVEGERDERDAEITRLQSDREYVVGWNDGFDHVHGPLRFPTMLRKMWSGGEVQKWLDEQRIEAARVAHADEGSALQAAIARAEAAEARALAAEARMGEVVKALEALPTAIIALDWRTRKDWTLADQANRHGELQEMIAAALAKENDHG